MEVAVERLEEEVLHRLAVVVDRDDGVDACGLQELGVEVGTEWLAVELLEVLDVAGVGRVAMLRAGAAVLRREEEVGLDEDDFFGSVVLGGLVR